MNLGAPELMIVLLVVLVMFGGQKLPKLARSLGQAQSEFRKGITTGQDDASSKDDEDQETVTMTRADLEALLEERDQASRDSDEPGSSAG